MCNRDGYICQWNPITTTVQLYTLHAKDLPDAIHQKAKQSFRTIRGAFPVGSLLPQRIASSIDEWWTSWDLNPEPSD